MALSLGFPRVGATDHPALRCPDFPRRLPPAGDPPRLLGLRRSILGGAWSRCPARARPRPAGRRRTQSAGASSERERMWSAVTPPDSAAPASTAPNAAPSRRAVDSSDDTRPCLACGTAFSAAREAGTNSMPSPSPNGTQQRQRAEPVERHARDRRARPGRAPRARSRAPRSSPRRARPRGRPDERRSDARPAARSP